MNKERKINLNYNGFVIHLNQGDKLVCLTDMWRAKGSVKSQKADYWLSQEATCHLLLHLVAQAKPELASVVNSVLQVKSTLGCRTKEFRAWMKRVKQIVIATRLITRPPA